MLVNVNWARRARLSLLLSLAFATLLGLWLAVALLPPERVSGATPAGAAASGITFRITKTVQPQVVSPGSLLTYQVAMHNASPTTATVRSITDVLPSGFVFVGMAPGSDPRIPAPGDSTPPDIVWNDVVTLPPTTSLAIRYWVVVAESVPYRDLPYTNTVTADVQDGGLLQSSTGVRVESPDVAVTKLAEPTRVISGSVLTYTVVFANRGNADGILRRITDTLPEGFRYLDVVPGSDITATPLGITGTISWSGPFSVTAGQAITLSYRTQAPPTQEEVSIVNRVVAEVDGRPTAQAAVTTTLGPETSYVFVPMISRRWGPPTFVLAKSSAVSTVAPGEPVTYTATIANIGSETGVLASISDTLPSAFMYETMLPGDIISSPLGNSGTIVWSGPITVAGFTTKTLSYRVRASDTPGTYSNKLDVWVAVGSNAFGPAQASVEVKKPLLLEDHFEGGIGPGWQPFLNHPTRLHPEQWYWEAGAGYNGSGALSHDKDLGFDPPGSGEADDALYMYMGPGAQQWTDYSFEAKVITRGPGNTGLWFRGTYEEDAEHPDWYGRKVGGYYFVFTRTGLKFWKMQTEDDCIIPACWHPWYLWHFQNPRLVAENSDLKLEQDRWYTMKVTVQGAHYVMYVDGVPYFDYTDTGHIFQNGTVGFNTYKLDWGSYDDVIVRPLP